MMKLQNYSTYIILLLFIFNLQILFGQRGLKLELAINNTEVGVLDPLHATFTLTNTTRRNISIKEPWTNTSSTLVGLTYKHIDSLEWIVLPSPEDFITHVYAEYREPKIVLKKGSSIKKNLSLLTTSYTSYIPELNYYFQEGNTYQLRGVALPLKGKKDYLYSNIITIEIKPYKGVDLLAQKWLSEKGESKPASIYKLLTYNWEVSLLSSLQEKREILNISNTFITSFPESKFTPWIKLYIVNLHLQGDNINGKMIPPDFDEADRILSNIDRQSDSYFNKAYDEVSKKFRDSKKIFDKMRD